MGLNESASLLAEFAAARPDALEPGALDEFGLGSHCVSASSRTCRQTSVDNLPTSQPSPFEAVAIQGFGCHSAAGSPEAQRYAGSERTQKTSSCRVPHAKPAAGARTIEYPRDSQPASVCVLAEE